MKKLFKLGIFAAIVGGIMKVVSTKKAEWSNLSEPEVRAKLEGKLGDKVPAEKLAEIEDKVVGKMREHGRLREDDSPAPAEG